MQGACRAPLFWTSSFVQRPCILLRLLFPAVIRYHLVVLLSLLLSSSLACSPSFVPQSVSWCAHTHASCSCPTAVYLLTFLLLHFGRSTVPSLHLPTFCVFFWTAICHSVSISVTYPCFILTFWKKTTLLLYTILPFTAVQSLISSIFSLSLPLSILSAALVHFVLTNPLSKLKSHFARQHLSLSFSLLYLPLRLLTFPAFFLLIFLSSSSPTKPKRLPQLHPSLKETGNALECVEMINK